MKKRLCCSFSIMSVLLILIPLINSSTTAAGGAPNPMMNITETLSMSSMSMIIEESAGGDEVLLMMDSEIIRILSAPASHKNPYGSLKPGQPCAQGRRADRYGKCTPDENKTKKPCPTYKRDC